MCRKRKQEIMSKKRVAPRAPFVVTVALAGASLLSLAPSCSDEITTVTNPPLPDTCPLDPPTAGASCDVQMTCDFCGSSFTCTAESVWVETVQGTCNPPAPVCPEIAPAAGMSCADPGLSCQYDDICGGTLTATCGGASGDGSSWQLMSTSPPCNPPPCPETAPPSGSACDLEQQVCDYEVDVGCGPVPVQATCTNGAWATTDTGPECNPPPPEPCTQYITESACATDLSCAWLVPGCGEPPLPMAGCHAKTPCMSDLDCMPGNTCQSVVIDPCWNEPCNACGANVALCLPPPAP
jgi:hypothetical protein